MQRFLSQRTGFGEMQPRHNLQIGSRSIICLLLLTSTVAFAQTPTFTKVKTGEIATDAGSSLSASWGDYNSDGNLDLFIANTGFESNFLYAGTGDSVFNRMLQGDIVNDFNPAQTGTWGDFNNDGHLDIFVAFGGPNNRFYSNKGNGSFTPITVGSIVNDGGQSRSAAWGDYNNDGHIDLFVANGNGESDFLYKNNGDGTFTKITDGPVVNDAADGTCAAWADFDSDGDLDLFVGNENGQNNALYENNDDGTFTAITLGPVVNDARSAQGASWGDYDNDGDLDLFVANGAFDQSVTVTETNALYQNNGDGTFTEITTGDIVTDVNDATGSAWGDYDNDGDLDLFVSTFSEAEPNLFYSNNGDGAFTKVANSMTAEPGLATGASWADVDNDGDLDLFVAQHQQTDNLLFINGANSNNWIHLDLAGLVSNKTAIGASVRLYARIDDEQVMQYQEISAQTGRNGQNSQTLEFGLGDATVVDSIRVLWPSGQSQLLQNVSANQKLAIEEAVSLENLTFTPTEDSYIKLGEKDLNFGDKESAKIEKDKFVAYLKFQVDGVIDEVLNAKLVLECADASDDGGTVFLAENTFRGTNEDWQEETLTADNAPDLIGLPLSALGQVSLGELVEFNVAQVISGNGLFSFAIRNDSEDVLKYFMKEGQTSPKLIVQVVANEVNTPPVAEDDIASTIVNTPVDISVISNDTGIDDDLSLSTLTIVDPATHGATQIDLQTGVVSYTPGPDYTGPDSFTYTIRDNAGDISNLATVAITVRPPNQPPTAVDDQASTTDNTPVFINVLANDTDDDEIIVETVQVTSPPLHGTAVVDASSGSITYSPDNGFIGSDSFNYTVEDSDGELSNEATVNITVTKGVELVTLTYHPTHDTQVRTFAPKETFGDRSTMKVDAEEFTGYLKFNLTGLIGQVQNIKLRLRVGEGSFDGGDVFVVSNNFTDNGQPWTEDGLNFRTAPVTTNPPVADLGAVTSDTWVAVDITPVIQGEGVYSFMIDSNSPDLAKYHTKEGEHAPEIVVTTLAVVGNDPPVANNDEIKARINTPATFEVLANDVDQDGVLLPETIAIVSQPNNGTLDLNTTTGEITYTPSLDFLGNDQFTYTVEDDEAGISNIATVFIEVLGENQPPEAVEDFATTFQGNAIPLNVLDNDVDVDGQIVAGSIVITVQPTRGTATVDIAAGDIVYSPPSGFVGNDSLSYQVSDDEGAISNEAKVRITIDKEPAIRTFSFRPSDDAQVKVTEANENFGSDPTAKVEADKFAAYLKFRVNNIQGQVRSAKLNIQVTDFPGDGGPNGGSIYVVGNTFDGEETDWVEDQLTFANAPDVTGSPLSTLGPVEVNEIVTFDVTAAVTGEGTFSFAILGDSSDRVKYFMRESLFAPALVIETTVIVENQPPVALNDAFDVSLNESATINVVANDSDPDGSIDPGSVQVVTPPASGTLSPDGAPNLLVYTPNPDFIGADEFTYRVRDLEDAVSNTATVTITIHPPNLPPVAAADVAATLTVFPVEINVLENDSDSDGSIIVSTLQITTPPANGNAEINAATGVITYTASENYVGLETFTYTVQDDDGATSNAATVTITVSEAPDVITHTFEPVEDAFVKRNSAEQFGTRATAKVEKNTFTAFFKFDASSVSGQIRDARLRLTVTDGADDGSDDGGSVFVVSNNFASSSTPWNEEEINDITSPPIDGQPLSSIGAVEPNQIVEFDVSQAISAPGVYSFAIANDSFDRTKYFTRESDAPPQLIVEAFTEPKNTPPFAVDDDTTTGLNQDVLVNVLVNDTDLDGSINLNTVTVTAQPLAGSAQVEAGGLIRYTPNGTFIGTDSFTYTFQDNESAVSNEAQVSVDVLDNSSWSVLDTGVDFSVTAIVAHNQDVYVAGTHSVNGSHHLQVWNGSSWSDLASGLDGGVNDMAVDENGNLYVAGAFTTIAGVNANYIAKWDGAQWSPLDAGLNNIVNALALDGSDLYAGGAFTTAGGDNASRVAKWDGSQWTAMGDGFDNTVNALVLSDNNLYAAGAFQNSGATGLNHVAQWDGSDWASLGNGVNGEVLGLSPNSGGIYASGNFNIAGLANASRVAHWDGSKWHGLAGGINKPARALASNGSALFAAGDFTRADNKRAHHAAKWDGKDWTPLGTGLDGTGRVVYLDGSKVYVGGGFETAGGLQANHVALWTEVNQPPIAVNDTVRTDIGIPLDIAILANDIDLNGNIDPATVTLQSQPANGQADIDHAGVVTYTPTASFTGSDHFDYQVADEDGGISNTARVVVFVDPPNAAPIAVDDAINTPQDTPVEIEITANDTDRDGSIVPASVTILTQAASGAIAFDPATSNITYTPNPGFTGTDTFTYTIEDNEGATSNTASVTVVVSPLQASSVTFTPTDDGMVKHNTTENFGERSTAKVLQDKFTSFFKFEVKDIDGDIESAILRLTVTDGESDGSDAGGTLFQVENNFDGTQTPWTEEDLTDPNSPPRISLPLANAGPVAANQVVEFDVSSVVTAEGVYSFALIGDSGDQAKYFTRESDSPPTLTIETLIAVENKPPVAVDDVVNARLNQPESIDVTANDNDPEGSLNKQSVAVVTSPVHGSLQPSNIAGALIYTPASGYLGDDQFTYTIQDNAGIISNLATVHITVHPENTPPVAVNDGSSAASGLPVTIDVLANDTDNDGSLLVNTLSIVSPPINGTASINPDATITYTSNAEFIGADAFTYTVQDNDNTISNAATVTIIVTEPPDVTTQSFKPTDDAQVKVANSPQNFGDKSTGKVEKNRFSVYLKFDIRSVSAQIKSAQVKMKVTDFDEDGSDDGGAIYQISNLFKDSDAPWDENGIVFQNAPEINSAALDRAGEVVQQQNIFFDVREAVHAPGIYSFAIANDSPDRAKYWMKEGGEDAPLLIVETFEDRENQPPVAVDDDANTRPEQPVTIDVSQNDIDPDGQVDPASVSVTGQPANGTVAADNSANLLTYTPNAGFIGTDTFTYTILDDEGLASNQATVTVTVSGDNLAPIAQNDTARTFVNVPVSITVLVNDSDSDGSLVVSSLAIDVPPANGSTQVNSGTGVITYTPASAFSGADQFTYTVQDNEGKISNPATVHITVLNSTAATVEFQPTDDGQVKHTDPGQNYGDKGTLKVEAGKFSSYLKFNVSGVESAILGAKLRLVVTDDPDDGSESGGRLFQASNDFSGTSESWTENLLNSGNAPAAIPPALGAIGAVQSNDVVEFDVSSVVTGNGIYSFCIETDSDDRVKYFAKEGSDSPPLLIIETASGGGDEPNVSPVAANDAAATSQDAPVTINILGNDSDSDGSLVPSSVQVKTTPGNGAVTITPTTGSATYTPDPGFTGSDQFTYTVRDNEGAESNTATVTISISATGSSQTLTFGPGHDGQVKLTGPGKNYGDKPTGKVEKDKFATYLKFEVSGLPAPAKQAKLRLTVTSEADDGSDSGGSVFSVSNHFSSAASPWTENLLNAGNAPEIEGAPLATFGPAAPLQQVEFDVSAAVQDNGTYSFALANSSEDQVKYYMKEGTSPPELVIETTGASGNQAPVAQNDNYSTTQGLLLVMIVTENDSDPDGSIVPLTVAIQSSTSNGELEVNPNSGLVTYRPEIDFVGTDEFTYTVEDDQGTASNTASVTINVTATAGAQLLTFQPVSDAFVSDRAATTNFGAANELFATANNGSESNKRASARTYLKFEVTGLEAPVLSATLRLFTADGSGADAQLYQVSNNFKNSMYAWDETLLVWDNAPHVGAEPLAAAKSATEEAVLEFNVTDAIAGNNPVSFAIENGAGMPAFYSKEGGMPPELIIETGDPSGANAETLEMITLADSDAETPEPLPEAFSLSPNYPNPFNAGTSIRYALPANAHVRLKIYNVRGQVVSTLVDEFQEAGFKTTKWAGKNDDGVEVASGMYFLQLEVKKQKFVQRMLLQK